MLITPVVLLIFNRPDLTKIVFEVIAQAKPKKLLLVADGPRFPEETEKCKMARSIVEKINWDCEILTNFSEINLGCKERVSSGLDWVFSQVEEAIILEDDCLPNLRFFQFCEELLDKYREDKRIMMISGTNYLGEWKSDRQSYHFSYYGGIWGWASWRRAWNYYDVNMKLWSEPEIKNRIMDVICDPKQYCKRQENFDSVYSGEVDTWDYQWSFARLSQSGLSIVPCVNLISNIGFGEDATHTKIKDSELAAIETLTLNFPLKNNEFLAVDRAYDRALFERLLAEKSSNLIFKLKRKIKKLIRMA